MKNLRIELCWLCNDCMLRWFNQGKPKTIDYLPHWICIKCYDWIRKQNKKIEIYEAKQKQKPTKQN